MERRSELKRGKPLARGTSQLKRSPLPSVRVTPEGVVKPPAPRRRPSVGQEERRARVLVEGRAQGRCEVCGAVGVTDWCHRVARSAGGAWTPANGYAGCRTGHGWAHANPLLANVGGWALRGWQEPPEWPIWLPVHDGWVFLRPDGSTVASPWTPAPAQVPCGVAL